MASIFRKTYTRPLSELPPDTRVDERDDGVRVAHWRDRCGRKHVATVTADGQGVRIQAGKYTAKYRRADGQVMEAATGCHDREAAKALLADLVRREELVRGRVLSRAEADVVDAAKAPIGEHVDCFLRERRRAVSAEHFANLEHNLRRVVADCGFQLLGDLGKEQVERWLTAHRDDLAPASLNRHRSALLAFAGWCVGTRRLATNPLRGLVRADEAQDRRRRRRALTEDELIRLLDAARRRPLQDALTVRRGRRRGQQVAEVGPRARQALEALGRERALLYAVLFTTGLRKNECRSLTVGQCILNTDRPFLYLSASAAKSRKEAFLPLRRDMAREIGHWIEERLDACQRAASDAREPVPAMLPPSEPLFRVPDALDKIFTRDLAFAGIPKTDANGRTLDVHCLRVSFCTHLSKAGVAPRVAQAAMRHSTINLTMTTYTDESLLPVAEAVEVLPALPLAESRLLPAPAPGNLAPDLAPTPVRSCQSGSRTGQNTASGPSGDTDSPETQKADPQAHVAENRPFGLVEDRGLEPLTYRLPACRSPN